MVTRFSILALSCLALAGCSGASAELDAQSIKPPKLNVVGDTFCRQTTAVDPATGERKFVVSWEPRDSPQTIQNIETLGAKYKRVCKDKFATQPPLK